jgi:prepilin-type N-terminal cleavage/methylation domain-containing protein
MGETKPYLKRSKKSTNNNEIKIMCKCGKNKSKGFTLIELLVVVVIIGLLAGILLITVRNAVLKARDGRIITALGQIRTQAEIYFDNQTPSTYAGLNNNATVLTAAGDAAANGGNVQWGVLNADGYVVWSVLASDSTLAQCVDSTGRAGKRAIAGLQPGVTVNCGL